MSAKVSLERVGKARQLKVRFCPDIIHQKIEKWMRKQGSKRDLTITKEQATVELLDRATANIKLD